jgi:hypothetical protein
MAAVSPYAMKKRNPTEQKKPPIPKVLIFFMDVNYNQVANGISSNNPSIPLVNSNNDATKINCSLQMPNTTRKNVEHLYVNNQHATNKKV